MIAECLQKEPSKRPTASELLKHPFFKKSKDRKYLTQTLLASGPSMETRVNKASKRQPGASGRLHRTITGEWVWSSEEEDNNGHSSDSEQEENRPMNRLIKVESSDSEAEDQSELTIASGGAHMQVSSEAPPINLVCCFCLFPVTVPRMPLFHTFHEILAFLLRTNCQFPIYYLIYQICYQSLRLIFCHFCEHKMHRFCVCEINEVNFTIFDLSLPLERIRLMALPPNWLMLD